MTLMDDLKRLERAGGAHSVAAKKLNEAAANVAAAVIDAVPPPFWGQWLPRDYEVVERHSNVGYDNFLVKRTGSEEDEDEDYWIDGTGRYLHGDCHAFVPAQTREGSLAFARDIAEGLFGMIAKYIEDKTKLVEAATAALEETLD